MVIGSDYYLGGGSYHYGITDNDGKKVQKLKMTLKVEAELAKHTNPGESIYKGIEEGLLEMGSMQNLSFISSIIGLLLMALGTVALCARVLLL